LTPLESIFFDIIDRGRKGWGDMIISGSRSLVLCSVMKLPYWFALTGQAADSVVVIPATAFFVDVLVKAYERSGYGYLPA
jgi:hypothetical protein